MAQRDRVILNGRMICHLQRQTQQFSFTEGKGNTYHILFNFHIFHKINFKEKYIKQKPTRHYHAVDRPMSPGSNGASSSQV
jgi:hypothetical protein